MKIQDHSLIHPEDTNNIHYWTKKWGVSTRQLNDAILYTGSLNPQRIKNYLHQNSWQQLLLNGFARLFRAKSKALH